MQKVMKSLKKGFKFKIALNKDIAYRFCLNPKNNICTYSVIEQVDPKITDISGLKVKDAINFKENPDILKKSFALKSGEEICNECIWDKKRLCKDNLG